MTGVLAVVLTGGVGTRLRRVLPTLPKPLAPVAGRPFLEWVLRYLREQGVERAVLSTGHHAEKMDEFVASLSIEGMKVSCVRESSPLGTAGGFLHAFGRVEGDDADVLACNGDSLVLTALSSLFAAIKDADAAILGVRVRDAARFGTLRTTDGALLGFDEKRPGAGLVNGGVYLFRRETVARFPRKTPLSFEYDVFPSLLASGARVAAVRCEAPFLDIGTEETLAQADAFIRDNMSWFG